MKNKTRYSIAELASAAGISRRAVRYYVQRKIIDPPCGGGRGSYYTEQHLQSILAHRAGMAEKAEHPSQASASMPPLERVLRIPPEERRGVGTALGAQDSRHGGNRGFGENLERFR